MQTQLETKSAPFCCVLGLANSFQIIILKIGLADLVKAVCYSNNEN